MKDVFFDEYEDETLIERRIRNVSNGRTLLNRFLQVEPVAPPVQPVAPVMPPQPVAPVAPVSVQKSEEAQFEG